MDGLTKGDPLGEGRRRVKGVAPSSESRQGWGLTGDGGGGGQASRVDGREPEGI